MTEVRLDPRQAPARAELLLGADFGRQARGRPIHGRLESEDGGADRPGPRLKLGAVRTRRLAASEEPTDPRAAPTATRSAEHGTTPRRSPGRGRHAGGGGAPSRGAAHDATHWNHTRAAGLSRERLEQRGVSTLSDAQLPTILVGPKGGRTADAVLDVSPA